MWKAYFTWCARKVMRLATLCTNRQCCCLPLHMAVRLTPAVDSVHVWICYSCYAIVESVWSVVFVRCVTKMDRQKFEQRCAIKVCVKLGESATVTCEKLQRAYGEHSLSRAQVFRWQKSFLEGQEQVEDEPRAGRSSTSKIDENVERMRSLVRLDRRLTLRMISSEVNLNGFTVHHILTQDLVMRKVCAKMVPKNRRPIGGMFVLIFWNALRGSQNSSVALSQVMDESWILEYDPETKRQVGSGILQNLPVPRKREWQIQNQIDAHLFFWQSGDRPQGICATRTNCQSNSLSGSYWKTQEKGGTCATRHCTHLDTAPRQGPMSHGSLHQWFFGRKKHSCGSSAPLFAGSQSLWLFFHSPGWKPTWKGAILVLWIISRGA